MPGRRFSFPEGFCLPAGRERGRTRLRSYPGQRSAEEEPGLRDRDGGSAPLPGTGSCGRRVELRPAPLRGPAGLQRQQPGEAAPGRSGGRASGGFPALHGAASPEVSSPSPEVLQMSLCGAWRKGVRLEKIRCCCVRKKREEKKEPPNRPGDVTAEVNLPGPPGRKLPNPRTVWQLPGAGKCGWQRVGGQHLLPASMSQTVEGVNGENSSIKQHPIFSPLNVFHMCCSEWEARFV